MVRRLPRQRAASILSARWHATNKLAVRRDLARRPAVACERERCQHHDGPQGLRGIKTCSGFVKFDRFPVTILAYFGAGPRTTWTKAPGLIHFSNAVRTASADSA